MLTLKTTNKKTFLSKPLIITLSKRFSGNKLPKGKEVTQKIGSPAPKPLPPSSLKKPTLPLENPKPLSPKHYNHNNVGGPKPLQPFDPYKDSYRAKPGVVRAIQELNEKQSYPQNTMSKPSYYHGPQQQTFTATSTSTTTSTTVTAKELISGADKDSFAGTTDNKPIDYQIPALPPLPPYKPVTLSNSTHSTTSYNNNPPESLTSVTGALVPYIPKSKNAAPIQYNYPTILIDTEGIAYHDHGGTSLPTDPKPKTPSNTFQEEILKIQKKLPHPPQEIPKDTMIPYSSQDKNKEEVLRLCLELSDQQLIKESVKRGMMKLDDNKSVRVKTVSEEIIVVGDSPNKIKITPLGKAYVDLVEKKKTLPQQPLKNGEEHIEYHLAALDKDNKAFLLDGPQKHMIVVYDEGNDRYYAIGYLTSQHTSDFFDDLQFISYQNAKETNNDPATIVVSSARPQRFTRLDNALLIEKNQLKILKWGKNYIQDLKEDIQTNIGKLQKELINKPMISYDIKGFSKETIIKACMAFDTAITNKIPHPKTYYDIFNTKKIKDNKNKYLAEKAVKAKFHKEKYVPTPFNE